MNRFSTRMTEFHVVYLGSFEVPRRSQAVHAFHQTNITSQNSEFKVVDATNKVYCFVSTEGQGGLTPYCPVF